MKIKGYRGFVISFITKRLGFSLKFFEFWSFGLFGVDELSLESMIVLFEVFVGVGGGVLTRFGDPFGKRSDSGCVSMLVVRLGDVSR